MRTVLCTLFDSNYLDKGIVLYNSLEMVSNDFVLYVLAMDNRCFDILNDISKPHLKPIRLSDFENEELRIAKANRSMGEYCWTCSSSLIKYVLDFYKENICTYIDADMLFYSDPKVLIDEMLEQNASVLIVGHRFSKIDIDDESIVGKYCVEFNTFKNDVNGLSLLNKWIGQCLETCARMRDGVHYGDQMYLNNWKEDYSFVHETTNLGAGVAPWNISQYRMLDNITNDKILVSCKKKVYELVFYHFENIMYINNETVNIGTFSKWNQDKLLIYRLYFDYLKRVRTVRESLSDKYGIVFKQRNHPLLADDIGAKIKIRNIIYRFSSWSGIRYVLANRIPHFLFRKKNLISITNVK